MSTNNPSPNDLALALRMCQKIIPQQYHPGQPGPAAAHSRRYLYTVLVTYTCMEDTKEIVPSAAILTQDLYTHVERKSLRYPQRVEIPPRDPVYSALQDGMVGFVYALTRDEYLTLEANDGPGGKFVMQGVGKDGAPAHQNEAYRAGGLKCENC